MCQQTWLSFKVDQFPKQFRMIFGEGPVVCPSGDLLQPATTAPSHVATFDITISISISIGAVCNSFLICGLVGSSSIEKCVFRVASEVAENCDKSVGPIVKALDKTQALSDLL